MIDRIVLPSGLTVLIETLPYVRSVALGYYLRSGSAVESVEHGGASHFLEHLVFKGTANRTTTEIAQVIDILGGDVDAFTGKEYTSFYAHVLDEQVDTALELLTDIVTSPRFTDEDLEMERRVILEEIKMVEDTPDDLVHEIFVTAFWPDHPIGRPILGTEETVTRLQRQQIEAHYSETFHPTNLIFCASGNVKPEQIIPFLEKTFPPDERSPIRNEWTAPTPNQHVIIKEKRELEQVHLCLGSRGYPQQYNERYAAALFNTILGGGMNITLEEMKKFKGEGATAKELADAKLHLKGSILLSLESTVSRMSGIARQEYYFGQQFSADQIIAAIDAVTLAEIRGVAETVVDPDSLSLTVIGNVKNTGISTDFLRASV